MILIPLIVIVLAIVGYFLYGHYKVNFQRARFKRKAHPMLEQWKQILQSGFPLFASLNDSKKNSLLEHISIFYFEKSWSEEISSSQRIIESAKACLPLINRKTNFYPQLKYIDGEKSFEQWLSLCEAQFIAELGKLAHQEMKGNFIKFSQLYFSDKDQLKELDPQSFKALEKFYH